MITFLACVALAPVTLGASENMNLVRSFKAGDTQTYSIHADMEVSGAALAIDARVLFKVRKTTDDGAEVAMSVRDFKMSRDGNDTGSPAPEEMISAVDKLGLPHLMSVQNEAWVYILVSFAGFVPGKEVEVGSSFPVQWTSKDKMFSASGKGKVAEVTTVDGVKAARLEYDFEVTPDGDSPGTVKCKSVVGLDGVTPISSEGTVVVDNGTIKFTVKKLKS